MLNEKKYFDNNFIVWLLDLLPVSVFWKDKAGVYLGCNYNFAKDHGFNFREDVLGKTDRDLVTNDSYDHYRKDDIEVMESGIAKLNIEEEQNFPNARKVLLLTNKVPLFNKREEVIGVLGVYSDITEIKKAKLVADKQAKTEFLEKMRHDIRTPLVGIVGCAQLIQMQADNPKKVAEYAEDLVQSSDALLEFLNKILESIKVATGEIPLLKKRFSLYKVLEQTVRLNKPQADVKHLTLRLEYDKTIPPYLLGDPIRIQRIMLELLTNALKFTDKGGVNLTARLMKNKTRAGQMIIELSVSDTGVGIPLDKQSQVYTRFKRLTPSYQGIYSGAGLGLSVVKQFIDDLGGEIQLDSQPNEGSTFKCFIPLHESLSTIDESKKEGIQSFEAIVT